MGGLPTTANGNNYIIVVSDYFSKWTEAYAVPNHTALTVADKLVTEFICRFGTPRYIHSDQGREFESELFQTICSKLGVKKTRTTPYRPESDGQVERFNRTLIQMLSSFVNTQMDDWDDHLPYVMMAYRSSRNSSTECTPNLVMLGRETSCPLDMMVGLPPGSRGICTVQYVYWVQETMRSADKFVFEKLGEAARRQKFYYDRDVKEREFSVDSFVWRWYPPAISNKLGQGWTLSDVNYEIKKSPQANPIVVHADHLKQYQGIHTPDPWVGLDSDIGDSSSEICSDGESQPPAIDNSPGEITPRFTRTGRRIVPPQKFSP
ncbi:uncharacterized protein LOC117340349 [Pecten maximus]|uniref:uncharacterized protein LOC117340349 n=1 Tax=Pecten maximus TaxID=6579 RepID=UPI00145817B9|nr:uncharacterized protein LOC117340349 [Pecten maximus]